MKKKYYLMPFIFSFLVACAGQSVTETSSQKEPSNSIIVAKDGGDFSTIQDAVNAAHSGNVIRIRGGVYFETVRIAVPGIIIEAFDPINEPVYVDGSDNMFNDVPPVWTQAQNNTYMCDYSWPLELITDVAYTNPGLDRNGPVPLFFLYEDGTLLRGYRNPYQGISDKKNPILIYGNHYGLGGMYSKSSDLMPVSGSIDKKYSRTITETGKYYYDSASKKLYVRTTTGSVPSEHILRIPVKKHLFHITASTVTLKNIHMRYSASFAVYIENASNCKIDQCVFEPVHFAVAVRNAPDTKVLNNLIREQGFWHRYTADDIIGTRFEISTICLDNAADSEGSEVRNNVILGTPFFISPARFSYSVHDNIAGYSVFGVWGAPRFANTAVTTESRIRVYNNIFHHMDLGMDIPPYFRFRGKMYIYRNYFYFTTDNKWTATDEEPPLFREHLFFYNNTMAFAGDGYMNIVPNPFLADMYFENNLYYAKSILYRHFVGASSNGQYPLAMTPQMGRNLYCGPLYGEATFREFQYKENTYLYIKTDEKVRDIGVKTTVVTKRQIFENYYPLEETSFYDKVFDQLYTAKTENITRDTWEKYFNTYWDTLAERFRINERSVARNKGLKLQESLPDSLIISDEAPDIGADELTIK